MVGGEIKNGDSKLKLNKVTASKKSPQTTLYRRWHKVGGGHHGGSSFAPLSVQWLMSRWDLAGNLNHPLKMTHHKSDAGETPLGLFPQSIWVFWEGDRKMMLKDRRLQRRLKGGRSHLMQAIDQCRELHFLGPAPPSQNGWGAICRTIWTLHPSEIERPPTLHTFFSYYFSPHCNMDDCRGPLFFPLRTSSCKKYPPSCSGGFYITNGHRIRVDSEMNRYLTHGFNRVSSVYAEMGKGFNPV